MFRISSFGIFLLLALPCKAQELYEPISIEILNFNQFESLLHQSNDTLYLVNFWASWCGTCREEIPALKNAAEKYSKNKFRLLMVSLDFPAQLETKLRPFLKTAGIKARLILLNDPHQNTWIDKVDPNWSGEIPFSLLYRNSVRESFSRSFQYHELDSIINLKITHL
jgi:thiol-disulfide isomerase/thioredoxin